MFLFIVGLIGSAIYIISEVYLYDKVTTILKKYNKYSDSLLYLRKIKAAEELLLESNIKISLPRILLLLPCILGVIAFLRLVFFFFSLR